MTNDELAIKCAEVFNEGKKEQQHRLEKLVKNHLADVTRANCQTELEKVMASIIGQFIEAVSDEGKKIRGFESMYL